MALTADVTKLWPKLEGAGQIRIGVEVVLKDNDVEVRRQSFTTNTEKTGDPEVQAAGISGRIDEWVNEYKAEKNAFVHAKMDAFETAIIQGVQL